MKPTTVRAEEDVRVSAGLYNARRTARFLLGDAYSDRMEQWTQFVRLAMEREGKTPLSAMLVLTKLTDEPMHHLFLMAAAVEVIEQE